MSGTMTFGVFHLFCGMGGGALGFQRAQAEVGGWVGRFRTLGGVDVDPEACADFQRLTGAPATCLDLFDREGYTAFHGHEPPLDWREATPDDLRRAAGEERPEVVFLSPPCKGFSGLLPQARAQSARYEALNRLTLRGVWLALEAWRESPPALVLLENVPRITSRGAAFLRHVKALLAAYGYRVTEGIHDLGAVGGLAQHRRRYLLLARQPGQVPEVVYRPPQRRVRAVGEVLGALPLPDDPRGGPLHRLPRLAWRTWLRLALIPAGQDWRALQTLEPDTYGLAYEPRRGAWRVQRWDAPASTVVGAATRPGASNGVAAIADPRLPTPHGAKYQGSPGLFGVMRWEDAAPAVTGSMAVSGSNTPAAVADPRLGSDRWAGHYRVLRWDEPSRTVTGQATSYGSNGAMAVADFRLGCQPRAGAYRVVQWGAPAPTVTGSGDIHAQGAAAVADPRVPGAAEQGVWVIVAEDGTWHRPLTTLELAVLQGFPTVLPDGSPLVLAGTSHARWRERIGNAVPPPAAEAIATTALQTLVAARLGMLAWNWWGTAVWVRLWSRWMAARGGRRR